MVLHCLCSTWFGHVLTFDDFVFPPPIVSFYLRRIMGDTVEINRHGKPEESCAC